MAVTRQDYTQTGSTTTYVVPFVVIEPTDIDVYVNAVLQLQQNTTSTADATHPQVISGDITQGTALTNYTVASNNGTFTFNAVLTAGDYIVIERTTLTTSTATFVSGSTIRAKDLNDSFDQIRFLAEEAVNTANRNVIESRERDNSYTAQNYKIENLADADTDDDAVNRAQLGKVITDDLLEGEAIDLTDVTGGTNSNKQVTISVEDSSKTNKGAVTINEGVGIDVTYTNGDAVISGEDSSKTNKGVVTINEAHAIGVTYTSGDAVISADKSTASQQGVVKITTPSVTDGNPITLTRPADGEIELTIANDSIDVQKIKGLDKADTSEYASNWTGDDDQVATVGALEARHDVVVSTSQPTTAQVGKQWLNVTPGNQEHKIYDGSGWRTVAVGQPFSPTTATIIRYVDATNGSDAADVTGFLPQAPLQSIKRAVDLINTDSSDGSLVVVAPGVYQETLPIQIQRKNISIVGQALRSVFVQPTQATETNTMFECNTGTLLANMTFVGLKASGTRGNSTYDGDSTYGLPENQGWCAAFFNNAVIKKSPYIQNCTSFNDSGIDNSTKYDQTNLPAGGLGGDTTSAMSGGGILCDGATPASTSPLRSFVVDSFTQINLDGPGILCTNNGYAQLVSFFGTFCHYHAKSLNGGQLNLSNCTTDFGRYGLIADGKSATNIFTATANGTTAAAQTTFTISGTTADASWHGDTTNPRPLDHMVVQLGGNANGTGGTIYSILASAVNGSGYDVTISNPDPNDYSVNLGLAAELTNGTTVRFFLRSLISTGGHTFEYCGAGTDYSAHPDNGGVSVEANQVKNLNNGNVWQSSTDENGKFKVGSTFTVNQKTGTVVIPAAASSGVQKSSTTGSAIIPTGTTAQRDGLPANGYFRYNSDDNAFEGYVNGAWGGIGGLANNATGTNSLGIGTNALDSETSGSHNTAVGTDALTTNTTGSSNVASGYQALYSNTTGYANVANGQHALKLNTTGIYNTANGYLALYSNLTGSNNIASGVQALYSNTTGGGNVASGFEALYSNTEGTFNIATGYRALKQNTTGTSNIANGFQTLQSNTTGSNNIANGYEALGLNITGYSNIANGFRTLKSNTSGHSNVANGVNALRSNTTGSLNTANGVSALYNNSSGYGNVANGYQALNSNTTGYYNVANGYDALRSNSSGYHNIANGFQALRYNTTGYGNVANGYESLHNNNVGYYNTANGYQALRGNTGGDGNVANGFQALYANTGDNNVAVGYQAGNSITTGSNLTVIGYDADASSATATNEITLGNASVSSLRIPGLQAGASNGQVLTYNSSNGNIAFATAGGAAALGDLSDGATSSTSLLLGTGVSTSSTKNTVVGQNAGAAIDSSKNTYVGNEAGRYIEDEENTGIGNQTLGGATGSNQTGTLRRNTAVGDRSLSKLANGAVDNTAVGAYSGQYLTTGGSNTLIGRSAGSALTIESSNTFVGHGCGDDTTTSNNTGLGAYVLDDNTAGTNNTASGYRALYKNTAGANNVAHGNEALYFNTTGDDNVGIGHNANRGRSGHTASLTTAVGTKALFINTTGDQVTALGAYACKENTTGDDNTGVGYGALQNNETGANNTAVGVQALYNHTGGTTTAVGMKAGFSQTGSNSCVYLGWYAGFGATGASAANNTCLGAMAGYGLTSGTNNTAAGYQALYTNTTGARNVAMGVSAMKTSIDASNNVIIGHEAGESLTNGDDNVAIGNSAGKGLTNAGNCVAVGEKALEVANQDGNTAVGYRAGQAQSSGENNTYIGKQAGLGNTAGSNTTIIGNSATSSSTTVSNEFTLGNSSISSLRCNTQTISSLSDGRDKTEVEDLPLGLNFIDTLRPVKFKWDTRDGNGKDGSFEAGFIAQDLQSAQSTSNADYLKMVMDENPDRLEAAYGQLIPVLVQAIKDLSTQVKQLQTV